LQDIIDRIVKRNASDVSYMGAAVTGVFSGAMMVIMTVTYASLIFSGELSKFVDHGIALGLTSVIVIGTVLTFFSRSSHLVVQIDDDTAPVFALLLAILAASLPTTLSAPDLLANLLAALFIATLISGITLTIFGIFHFGSFVQFLPYSVMGGYFAAVGWLLLIGAITMLTDVRIDSINSILELFTGALIWQWLPAVLIGTWLHIMSSRLNTGILLGGTIVVSIVGFFAFYAALGVSSQELMGSGLLIGPFAEQERSLLMPITELNWSAVHLQTSLGTAGGIASITLISLLSIILCVSGLSLTTRRDLDINHELKVSGIANIASASLGGMSALPSLSISKLAYDIHPAASRIIGLMAAVVGVLIFYFGMQAIAHIPKMILGALSFYIGLGFVKDWLIDGLKKFGAVEYSVIPIILVVSIFAGFLQGVVTGIIASIVLFVIKYSRIRIIRYEASGAELRSNLARDAEQSQLLKRSGDQIRVFTLQGYLFFGTAGSLYRNVLESIDDPRNDTIQYVILDFAQVIGVDSSATLNFEKLAQRLVERKIFLITTSLQKSVLEILRRGGLDLDGNAFLIQHVDLDQGLEWCENSILTNLHAEAKVRRGIFERINDAIPHSSNLHKLGDYLEKSTVTAGQVLTRIADKSDKVFFLESCTASAYIIDSNKVERRVSGAGRGAVYGEIGFILGIPRTALVRTDTEGEIYSLSRDALQEMEKEEPELAAALMRYLAETVTERLASTTSSLRAVL
jgi:SulP family sulfate permease